MICILLQTIEQFGHQAEERVLDTVLYLLQVRGSLETAFQLRKKFLFGQGIDYCSCHIALEGGSTCPTYLN